MMTMTVEDAIGIYTVAELEQERERDERSRWELLGGELVMTPAPSTVHQRLSFRLAVSLDAAAGNDLEVFPAPYDVHLSEHTVLQPDVVLAAADQIMDDGIHGAPVLAVEVLSPSTRRRDLVQKREILERAGCPHYWVLDPDKMSLWVWRLVKGTYVLEHHVTGDEEVRLTVPVEVTLCVNDLLRSSP